ncbi:hypothetical protein MTR_1g093360 [Medicago truncatula]|uniref:Uncharacterized protein n=1 Tax=Medicago truncatula TaxID=3880 RepID=G7I487_MEDTR|nr:hypothetical protein MTR_1g093360 [Medicago truncatula]
MGIVGILSWYDDNLGRAVRFGSRGDAWWWTGDRRNGKAIINSHTQLEVPGFELRS